MFTQLVRKVPKLPMGAHCPRAHSSRRHLIIATLVCVATTCVATSFNPERAEAATHVHATHVHSNITRNTTWTTAGSPYILDTSVSVTARATLTIRPGVTVEFSGTSLLTFFIDGTIKSIGTAAHPITFTSAQGAAGHGAPGQYEGVNVQAGTRSRFSYTHFYYGGTGSGGFYAYGVLTVDNLGTRVSIDHSVFEHNEYSGLQIGDGVVSVTSSTFKYNGDGISQLVGRSPGQLILSDSIVSNNARDGLFFDVLNRPPGSSVHHNLITANGSHGIEMWMHCSTPRTSFPHGNKNDIYANGDTSDPADGSELYTLYPCRAINVDWTGNYWGEVRFYGVPTPLVSPLTCEGAGPPEDWFQTDFSTQPHGYLGYSDWTDLTEPPPGPISTGEFLRLMPLECPDGTLDHVLYHNVFNSFRLRPGQISRSYIPIP